MSLQVFRNIEECLTLQEASYKEGRRIRQEDLSILKKAAMVVQDKKIIWIGEQKKLPKQYAKKSKEVDLMGSTVLPGFVECHTHSVFAGDRAEEFELRNQGMSYQEIAKKGGGILSTRVATRKASKQQLQKLTNERVENFIEQGVTTLEIKSGYGLNLKDELKLLEVIRSQKKIRCLSTFMGAHGLPKEFNSSADYLEFLIKTVLPQVKKKKLADRVDIFLEKGFFEILETKNYLQAAKKMGFEILLHADQLTLSGGAQAAIEMQAISADHLLQIGDKEIASLAKSNVTCVLLPTSDLYMKCAYPKARDLIDQGARVALATDFNPGTSPTQDLTLVGLLSRLEMKMSLPEVISAYTVGAAHALNLQNEIGSLEVGKKCGFLFDKAKLEFSVLLCR